MMGDIDDALMVDVEAVMLVIGVVIVVVIGLMPEIAFGMTNASINIHEKQDAGAIQTGDRPIMRDKANLDTLEDCPSHLIRGMVTSLAPILVIALGSSMEADLAIRETP